MPLNVIRIYADSKFDVGMGYYSHGSTSELPPFKRTRSRCPSGHRLAEMKISYRIREIQRSNAVTSSTDRSGERRHFEWKLTRLPFGQAQRSHLAFWPRHWQAVFLIKVPLAHRGLICLQLTRFSSRTLAAASALAYASGSAMAAARALIARHERMARNFMVISGAGGVFFF